MENSKFTDEEREKAIELLTDNGDLNIMELGDFMYLYEPWQVAKMVKQANLTLEHDYIRVNDYYSDTHEADSISDLVSDDEIENALQELQ